MVCSQVRKNESSVKKQAVGSLGCQEIQSPTEECSKLIVGEEVVQDPEHLLDEWANHFRTLAKSTMQEGLESGRED